MAEMEAGDRELIGIERTVIDLLRDGPRMLDDIARVVPEDSFAQVFLTVDRLSREGLVRLFPDCRSYRVSLVKSRSSR
jgi:hypothetical protein